MFRLTRISTKKWLALSITCLPGSYSFCSGKEGKIPMQTGKEGKIPMQTKKYGRNFSSDGTSEDRIEYENRLELIRYLDILKMRFLITEDFLISDKATGKFPPLNDLLQGEMDRMLDEKRESGTTLIAGKTRLLKVTQNKEHLERTLIANEEKKKQLHLTSVIRDIQTAERYDDLAEANRHLNSALKFINVSNVAELPIDFQLQLSGKLLSHHQKQKSKETVRPTCVLTESDKDRLELVDIAAAAKYENDSDIIQRLKIFLCARSYSKISDLGQQVSDVLPEKFRSYSIRPEEKADIRKRKRVMCEADDSDDSEVEKSSKAKSSDRRSSSILSRRKSEKPDALVFTRGCQSCGCYNSITGSNHSEKCCIVCSYIGTACGECRERHVKNSRKCNTSCEFIGDTCQCKECNIQVGAERMVPDADKDALRLKIYNEIAKFSKYGTNKQDNSRKRYQKDMIKSVIDWQSSTESNYDYSFHIGETTDQVKCCMNGFLRVYGMSDRTFYGRVNELKKHVLRPERLPSICQNRKEMMEVTSRARCFYGVEFNEAEKGCLLMPDWNPKDNEDKDFKSTTLAHEECVAWMRSYFDVSSESQPNRYGQRHLRQAAVTKEIIHAEYVRDMGLRCDSFGVLNYRQFCKAWKNSFPDVRIQKFVAVQTKCNTCADLDALAQNCGDNKAFLSELRDLRRHHSQFYKAQRSWYHDVREMAMQNPSRYISSIGDGMAQSHNVLPSYGTSGGGVAPATFDTHFQGFITHGVGFTIFRSFGNVGKGTNVALHAWLMHLEREYIARNNTLPDTVYYQIDGGPENANSIPVAMAELLVHWGLTKKIYITRLPPGHTHEDIDGMFGVIWRYMWRKAVMTPQQQESYVRDAFRDSLSKGRKVEVVDIFAVPDYRKYFEGKCGEDNEPCALLNRVYKGYLSKLQFVIEKVDVCAEFPLGVKTVCREYPTESAAEVMKTERIPFQSGLFAGVSGLTLLKLKSTDRPTVEDNNGKPAGLRVLNKIPQGQVPVAEFKDIKVTDKKTNLVSKKKVHSELNECVVKMENEFGPDSGIGTQWRQFFEKYPQGTAEEYIQTAGNSYKIPFANFFDGSYQRNNTILNVPALRNISCYAPCGMRIVETVGTASMEWGHNGHGFDGNFKSVKCPRMFPNFNAQGLTSPYLLPTSNTNKRKSRGPENIYKKESVVSLRQKCLDRGLSDIGLKIDLEKRLQAADKGILPQLGDHVPLRAAEAKSKSYYEKMKVPELKTILAARNLSVEGSKSDLIKRLRESYFGVETEFSSAKESSDVSSVQQETSYVKESSSISAREEVIQIQVVKNVGKSVETEGDRENNEACEGEENNDSYDDEDNNDVDELKEYNENGEDYDKDWDDKDDDEGSGEEHDICEQIIGDNGLICGDDDRALYERAHSDDDDEDDDDDQTP